MQKSLTLKTAVKATLTALFATTVLTACGSDLPSLGSALDGSDSAFSLANRTGAAGDFGGKGGQKGGQKGGHKGGPGMMGAIGFGADLDLSTEQQAALKALHDEYKPDASGAPAERPDMSALKAAIETAFVADSFDITALEALQPARPDDSARATQQATILVKSWAILTDAQKATVKAKQAEMANIERPERPEFANDSSRVNPLIEKLSLSTEQATALEALKPERPDPAAMKAQHEATQAAIQAELDQASPSIDAIAALLSANRPADKAGPLAHLAELHAILTPAQRQSFVELGLAAGPGGHGGPGPDAGQFGGGHDFKGGPGMGGPGGFGGPGGGPGGPGGMPGGRF